MRLFFVHVFGSFRLVSFRGFCFSPAFCRFVFVSFVRYRNRKKRGTGEACVSLLFVRSNVRSKRAETELMNNGGACCVGRQLSTRDLYSCTYPHTIVGSWKVVMPVCPVQIGILQCLFSLSLLACVHVLYSCLCDPPPFRLTPLYRVKFRQFACSSSVK